MKVLLANSTCKVGGVSTFLLSLRHELQAQGHDCRLFFFERGPMEALLPPDVPVQFGTLADCLRLVAREQIDVVHANNVDWPTGISAVRRLGARLVLTAHKVREPAWTYGWRAGNCDGFVAVADWIRQALQPFTDVPIRTIPNGIDTRRFHPGPAQSSATPIVAWVGRGSAARKRLSQFARMAPILTRAGLRIWVIDPQGPAHLTDTEPALAQALGAAADVWHGVPVDRMPDVYRQVAASGGCIVSTASMEGLPLTLLEAQACGCIVIGADVRGVRECVSADSGGVLYPADTSPTEAAAVVVETLKDRAAMPQRQRLAVSRVTRDFSLARMTADYLGVYRGDAAMPAAERSGRRRLSPLFDWPGYLDERLGVGYAQLDASEALAATGDRGLAAHAAVEAFRTAPTMFAQPRRLAHLFGQWLPRRRSATAQQAGPTLSSPEVSNSSTTYVKKYPETENRFRT